MDIYRIPSSRLEYWDYGWRAAYFVTTCTAAREHYFGTITNGVMILSEIGKIVQEEWIKTPKIRPDMNIRLDEFIVMPNHIHGIIIIGRNQYNKYNLGNNEVETRYNDVKTQCIASLQQTNKIDNGDIASPQETNGFENESIASLQSGQIQSKQSVDTHLQKNKFSPQSKNLASIIRGFKSSVTKQSRLIHADFGWQTRFHEHIIRNKQSYYKIRNYIRNNPGYWINDQLYS
jgi:REP element-mobilizing transposase RayT